MHIKEAQNIVDNWIKQHGDYMFGLTLARNER